MFMSVCESERECVYVLPPLQFLVYIIITYTTGHFFSPGILPKVTQCRNLLGELEQILTPENAQLVQPGVEYIHTLLTNALLSAQGLINSDRSKLKQLSEFSPKLKVYPGQRHEKQPQFHRTTKPRRLKTKFLFK